MRIFGKGFNFGQDGPGNRLVYHLSGCNMRCIWCSNPDGMDMSAGNEVSCQDVIKEILSSRMMFFSGGGVTFTGGEATLQKNELITVLKAVKEIGIHTAIETNGTSERLNEILEYVDYLIMDFKHFDSERLKEFTGVGNQTICKNFEENCNRGRQQHIRIPLINGINAYSPEEYAGYFSKFDTKNTVFEFLSYQEYGKEKWKGEYKVKNGFITEEILKEFKDTFDRFGLKVVTT